MTMTLILEGTITAVGPLTVTRPHDKIFGSDDVGRLPRAGVKALKTQAYFPGSSFSGALRRACRDVVRIALEKANPEEAPFNIDQHYMLTQGVDTTNKVASETSSGVIDYEKHVRQSNPLLSLFGRWKLPGHLSIGDLVPELCNEECVFMHGEGARVDEFSRSPDQVAFLDPDSVDKLKRILHEDRHIQKDIKALESDVKALASVERRSKGNEKAEIKAQIDEINKAIEAKKGDKSGSTESIQRTLPGYEAFVPGARFSHKMVLANADETEIGLLVDALLKFSEMPYLGGHYRNGCGEVAAQWEIKYRRPGTYKAESIGLIKLSHEDFEMEDFTDEKVLENGCKTWAEKRQGLEESGLDFTKYLRTD